MDDLWIGKDIRDRIDRTRGHAGSFEGGLPRICASARLEATEPPPKKPMASIWMSERRRGSSGSNFIVVFPLCEGWPDCTEPEPAILRRLDSQGEARLGAKLAEHALDSYDSSAARVAKLVDAGDLKS